ncbi:MAG: pyridoxamine 5'-phosphate oxidase family protein [Actinomycetota bacterium]|nr:pyridoxamine 5'-phosphate oxidase family protein [Actinomycetota bacterium]
MPRRELNELERAFLADPPRTLARIATVDPDGMPHVVPGGWSYDGQSGDLVLGGRDVLSTRRAGNVRRSGVAAVVIDGVETGSGWAPWALVVRGPARLDEPVGAIRVSIAEVTSWGLEELAARGSGASGPQG